MAYSNFSTHAQTGLVPSAGTIVSPNEFAPEGQSIGYPQKIDVYVRKIANSDGSQTVTEIRQASDIVGNRLYLYHKPVVDAANNVTTISSSQGVINTILTNAKQGSITYSTNPTSEFSVTYNAAPDCISQYEFNTIQNSVMEIENLLGPGSNTGFAALRNLAYAVFDNPGTNLSGIAPNALYLSYLNKDITIGSQGTSPTAHVVTLGAQIDQVNVDATGFKVYNTDGTKVSRIELGGTTGDLVTYQGIFSGEGPCWVGGSEWATNSPGFSGESYLFGMDSGAHYSGSMLRVYGDATILGGLQVAGPITLVHTTGQTSTVLGDFTVQDELFVYGVTHTIGNLDANRVTAKSTVTIQSDIVASNTKGSGPGGQCLVDNLDPSEVAHTYKAVSQRMMPNSIISAPIRRKYLSPQQSSTAVQYSLNFSGLPGDLWVLTGDVNANAGPSGSHPYIIQLNMLEKVVSGTYDPYSNPGNTTGSKDGWWSPGMMDPGNTWVKIIAGQGLNYTSPVYGYTVEGIGATHISGINVFCPEGTGVSAGDTYMLYNPNAVPYEYIYTTNGANPTFQVSGSSSDPLRISFIDEVRELTAISPTYNLRTALENSVSGLPGSPFRTGVAYIVADSRGTDIESPPLFKARAVPFSMPGEVVVGEVIASQESIGGAWTQLETVSYRAGNVYDSSWIPIVSERGATGRAVPEPTGEPVYFSHHLGPDVNLVNTNIDIWLAKYGTTDPGTIWGNQTQTFGYSLFGQDSRNLFPTANGSIERVQLHSSGERSAGVCYLDGKLIGLVLDPQLHAPVTGTAYMQYMRVVMRRDA